MCRDWAHSLSGGWRWWPRFQYQSTDGYRKPSELWSSQMRIPVSQYLNIEGEHVSKLQWRLTHNMHVQVLHLCETSFCNTTPDPETDSVTNPAFCWRRARCQRPAGADRCVHETAWELSLVWWTPRCHHQARPADAPDCLYEGGHQRTSAEEVKGHRDAHLISIQTACSNVLVVMHTQLYLYFHGFGLHHIDLVPVATPHLVMDHSHAADGVMWSP